MSDVLCTFSGKYGDILWSLPTAREISRMLGKKVDFFTMPYYDSLAPLLEGQSYIERAGVISDWVRINSNCGDQPWSIPAPFEQQYAQSFPLTYKAHPGISAPSMPLIHFVAFQHGIQLKDPIVPFIEVDDKLDGTNDLIGNWIAWSFNEQYDTEKQEFKTELQLQMLDTGIVFVDVSKLPWKNAAWTIKHSVIYVGCRSACWVLAQGIGKETITFEPHPARHSTGFLGKVFGNPYGQETPLPFNLPARESAKAAASMIKARLNCLQS